MKIHIAVWETHVTNANGSSMHFDIIAPLVTRETTIIYGYGNAYLESKQLAGLHITSQECQFSGTEPMEPEWEEAINRKGYYIRELENCT